MTRIYSSIDNIIFNIYLKYFFLGNHRNCDIYIKTGYDTIKASQSDNILTYSAYIRPNMKLKHTFSLFIEQLNVNNLFPDKNLLPFISNRHYIFFFKLSSAGVMSNIRILSSGVIMRVVGIVMSV